VTWTLEVGICKWHVTHRLVMMHVSMKFHEIFFVCLEIVVWTRKEAYLSFDLLVTLTSEVGTYKWHATHCIVMLIVKGQTNRHI